MSREPERLGASEDEADRELGSLLAEARGDVSEDRLASVAKRLGIAPVPPGGAGSPSGTESAASAAGSSSIAPPAAGALGSGLAGKAFVAAAVLAVAGAAVLLAVRERPTAPAGGAAESARPAPEAAEARAEPAPEPASEQDRSELAVGRDQLPSPRPPQVSSDTRRARAPARVTGVPPVELDQEPAAASEDPPAAPVREPSTDAPAPAPGVSEAVLLARARRAVASDPSAALAAAEEHAVLFPEGILAQEREVVRIEALARLGRMEDARRHLAALERRWPSSPHRARLRGLVGR